MDAALVNMGTTKGPRRAVMAVLFPRYPPAYDIKDVVHTATTHRPMDAALVDSGTTGGPKSAVMAVSSPKAPPACVTKDVVQTATTH